MSASGATEAPPAAPAASSERRIGCASAVIADGLAWILLVHLFYTRPFAGIAAALAIALPVLAWRRPRGWRWAAVPLLAGAGAAIGLWWDATLGRPPGTSVAANLGWIGQQTGGWILYAGLGVGGYGLLLLRFVPPRALRGLAVVVLVPAMVFSVGFLGYAQRDVREPLGRDRLVARGLLWRLGREQESHRAEHGAYAATLSELPGDRIRLSSHEGFVLELESADSTGFSARAFHPRMPEPCTVTVRERTRSREDLRCPEPIPYHALIHWGL